MRVIGILFVALGLFWVVTGVFFVINPSAERIAYPAGVIALAFSLFFFLPGALGTWIGSRLIRWSNRRKRRRMETEYPSLDLAKPDVPQSEAPPIRLDKPTSPSGDIYRTASPRPRTDASELIVAVCRSCGRRKTIRSGTQAECEYCGSVLAPD
ncbi:hypothetical protein [Saccharibacillus sacchari]|uniref:Uncharacterized protein n=1 Tax=Saccharibacillus sacchari TaxID=456493 RepID=A0ACC6P6E1_9BACL